MNQAEQRFQEIQGIHEGHQITVTSRIAGHQKEIITISLIDHRTENHYFVQHTFETLPSIAQKCFQSIRQLYEKLSESIKKKNNRDLIIQPNGIMILKHMRKDRKCQSQVTIKTKLRQMNMLTDAYQAIELLFSKTKENRDFIYQMKNSILTEVKESFQKQSKQNQKQLKNMRDESSALKLQITQLENDLSLKCSEIQMNEAVNNIGTELEQKITQLQNDLSLKCSEIQMNEAVNNIGTELEQKITQLQNDLSLKCSEIQMNEAVNNIGTELEQKITQLQNDLSLKCSEIQMNEAVNNIGTELEQKITQLQNDLSLKCSEIQMNEAVNNIGTELEQKITQLQNDLSLKCSEIQMNEAVNNIGTELEQKITQLQNDLSLKCSEIQMNEAVNNIGTELEQKITQLQNDLHQELHRKQEYIQTQCEKVDRRISMLQQKLQHTNARLSKIDTLQLSDMDQTQLKTQLQKCSNAFVDKVSIYNNRVQTANNQIEIIQQRNSLPDVGLPQMKSQFEMEILKSIPQLKQLTLLLHKYKLSSNFMTKLCQIKQLTSFCLNVCSVPDCYRILAEEAWFVGWPHLQMDNLPSTKELLELSRLPKLENIEISQVNDKDNVQVIGNMRALKTLTLGYDCKQKNQLNRELLEEVCKLGQLRTLSLVGVTVLNDQLTKVISKNMHLSTIISKNDHENVNIDDATVECMQKLTQLQTLCIQNNTVITGEGLSKLNSLKMLEIWNCRNVNKMNIKKAIIEMPELYYIKLNNNIWVDDDVMMSIQSCKRLKYLNVYQTSVSGQGVKHLEGLAQLNTLICGSTDINGKDLIDLTKDISSITRLDIYNLQVNNDDLLKINANCPAITHLDVSQTQITVQALLKMKQLKVVRSDLNNESKKRLSDKKIKNY